MTEHNDNIHLKKKVTLRTKSTEASEEVQKPKVALKRKQPTPPTPPSGRKEEPKGKGKWYAAALAGLLFLGGGGYYLSQQGEDKPQSVVAVAGTGQSDETAKEEATKGNQKEQKQEGEIPADAAPAENPSGGTPSKEAFAGDTPVAPSSKTDAATPTSSSTSVSPSTSQSIQEKTKATPAQTKQVTGPSSAMGTVEEEAKEVIRGKYGNGDIRKRNLGDRYAEIQSKVNEMYRNGLVH